MTGTLAQLIALAAYGNQFLKTGVVDPAFYPVNSTFQNCEVIDFHEFRKPFFFRKYADNILRKDPLDWLDLLKKEKTKKLHLFFRHSEDQSTAADYRLAGFIGGGGTWMIEQQCQGYSYYWSARWQLKEAPETQSADHQTTWIVNYARFARKIKSTQSLQNPEVVRQEFRQALSDIASFAFQQNLKGWAETFQKALYELTNLSPGELYYYKDFVPDKAFNQLSLQLLFAASKAWVFGGMGSWNDLSFDDKEIAGRYEELSSLLYNSIVECVKVVVNE
ncbi:MAG TPA: hypothetical protein PLU53_09230 [Bacteroidia bacterium]|nr:hypothetical protein [Bacteroidia bacterium]